MAINLKATMAQTTIDKTLQAGELDEALDACRMILRDAREQQDAESEAIALIGLAQVNQFIGKFHEARVFADGGLRAAEALNIPELIVNALNTSANIFFTSSFKIDEAETDYRAALQVAHGNDDLRGVATALIGIAAVFNHAQDNDRAITYAREAFDFARDVDDAFLMVRALIIIGNSYMQLEKNAKPEKSLKAFDDALDLCEAQDIDLLKGYIYSNKGLLLTEDHRYFDDGLELLDVGLAEAQKINCAPHEFTALYFTGLARMRVDQYDIARDYFETMLNRAQTWKNKAYEGMTFYELGRLHIKAEDYDLALASFDQAWLLSRETMNPFYEAQTEAALGLTYSLKREYKLALKRYMAARTLYDALEDDARMSAMTQAIIRTYINRFVHSILLFLGLRTANDESVSENDDSQPMA